MDLTICFPPHSPLLLRNIDKNCSVLELKTKLFSNLPGISDDDSVEMRLVCGGRVLQDHLNLSAQGVVSGAKIYVAVKSIASQVKPAPSTQRKNENEALMGPLIKFLSDNPEFYQKMILSNPQMQKLVEKNPELRHALSDPSTLKSMLNAATNPKVYNEMLRGHDRAMSNLENIPEGFSHLKKVYSTLQEPMYDAFTPKTRINYNEIGRNEGKRTTTSEPVPNPWAPKMPTPIRPTINANPVRGKPIFGAQKRKLTFFIDDDDDEELFNRSLAGIAGMGLNSPLLTTAATTSKEVYSQQLMEMHLLGFVNDEENVAALRESEGNVSMAIDRIISKRSEKK